MKYFQRFLSVAFLTALFFLPQLSYSAEENLKIDALAEVKTDLNDVLPKDALAKAYYSKNSPEHKGIHRESWKPYMANTAVYRPGSYPFIQANIGFGFLRFSGIKGGLGRDPYPNTLRNENGIKGRLAYSRTPLVEVILGYSLKSWFQFGFSWQHQGDIDVQTKPQIVPVVPNTSALFAQFSSNLKLDAFTAKCYFTYLNSLVIKGISTEFYFGFASGPAIQSWTNMRIDALDFVPGTSSILSVTDNFSVKNKYCCNWFFMGDLGIKLRSVIPDRNFEVSFGCKYNEWGQARNLGLVSQQKNYAHGTGFKNAIGIKTIYQFAPYMGFQLDF